MDAMLLIFFFLKLPVLRIISLSKLSRIICANRKKNKIDIEGKIMENESKMSGFRYRFIENIKNVVPIIRKGTLNIPNQTPGLVENPISIFIVNRSRKTFKALDIPYLLVPNFLA
jgi:hypothetical protein